MTDTVMVIPTFKEYGLFRRELRAYVACRRESLGFLIPVLETDGPEEYLDLTQESLYPLQVQWVQSQGGPAKFVILIKSGPKILLDMLYMADV